MARRFIVTLAAGLTAPIPVLAQETGSPSRGRAYAERHCAECHAVHPDQAAAPNPAIASFHEIANTPGMTAMALKVWFQSPHPNMPLLVIAPDDRDDVVAYITSLRQKN